MTPRRRALVALNPATRQGTGMRRFETVKPLLEEAFYLDVVATSPDRRWEGAVAAALARGIRVFVAAGGDGTVHALAGALLRARPGVPLDDLILGAVGLGSSNDFHKPVLAEFGGMPVRLDATRLAPRDVLVARWRDDQGLEREDVVVASASLGVTAAANGRFNRPGPVLGWLERHVLDGAILWAAAATLLAWRNVGATLVVDGATLPVRITNLSLLKTPWLSGGLRYDTPVSPDDGRFVLALAHDLSLAGRFGLLLALARGRFTGRPRTRTWHVDRASVTLERAGDLELDGEVFPARQVRVHVHPWALPVCGPGGPVA